ncbi:ribose 5-phosphate isomerase [Atractiella rhizophila]|nr:ribose 5-phosphate isomerase [Atractiella rhizophila]
MRPRRLHQFSRLFSSPAPAKSTMPSPALSKLLTTPSFSGSTPGTPNKPPDGESAPIAPSRLQTSTIAIPAPAHHEPESPYHQPLSPIPMTPVDAPVGSTRRRKDSYLGIGLIKNWTPPVVTPPTTLTPEPPKAAQPLTIIESAKRLASRMAVDNHIRPEHRVIGIGSGSTVPYVVEYILEKGGNENRWFIPTGFQSKELIVRGGLKLGDVDQFPTIDVTIDGADEVDPKLNAIKGGGACHLREKVLAEAADEFVIVADYRKNSPVLGRSWRQGVPIEVAPFAYSKVLGNILRIPGALKPVLRMGKAKAGPVVTDNGNFVIDAPFDEEGTPTNFGENEKGEKGKGKGTGLGKGQNRIIRERKTKG